MKHALNLHVLGQPITKHTNFGGCLAHHGCLVQIEGPVQVARRSDVDMNGHINNVTYLAWALETVPREVYYNYELEQVSFCTI